MTTSNADLIARRNSTIGPFSPLFYAEPLDPYVIFGAGVIFAGIWLNIRSEIRPKGHTETITNP